MKTPSLTPWFNLFSTELKYSITVTKSRYNILLAVTYLVTLIALAIIFFTYAYQLTLAIAIFFVFLFGIWLTSQKKKIVVLRFTLNNEGICSFETPSQHIEHYQLLVGSRFSFLGCWLLLQPTTCSVNFSAENNYTVESNYTVEKKRKKRMFIYRDSLSLQDFSRLSSIISQLNYSH